MRLTIAFLVMIMTVSAADASSAPNPPIQVHGLVKSHDDQGRLVVQVDRILMHPGAVEVRFTDARTKVVSLREDTRVQDAAGAPKDATLVADGSEIEAVGTNDGIGSVLNADAVVIHDSPATAWANLDLLLPKTEEPRPRAFDASLMPAALRGGDGINDYIQLLADSIGEDSPASITVEEIGRSQKGKPIIMVTVSGRDASSEPPRSVMVVAAQHGDEPAGMRAMVELVREFAASSEESIGRLMDKVTLHIIPVSNPDGSASFQRPTADGRNLNRDWDSYSLPESQAALSVMRRVRPDALIDLHEQTPIDREGAYVVGTPASKAARLLTAVRAAFHKHGIHIPVRSQGLSSGSSLLHQCFAAEFGRPGFLVESKYTRDPKANLQHRSFMHLVTVMAVVKALAAETPASHSGK